MEIPNKHKLRLLKLFDSSEIWRLNETDFKTLNIRDDTAKKIYNSKNNLKLTEYEEYINKNGIKLISVRDKELYPNKLNNIDNKPAFLYIRGKIENLFSDNVAIVGSRKATDYGKSVAREVGKQLADKNINIVSGLAIGIDKYAHLGALESGIGKTIAVLGTGVSNEEIYPYQNKRIFERILENERHNSFRV